MKKAVIFDMDGLLINSEPLWNKALIKLIEKYGDIKKYSSTGNIFLGMKQEEELQYLIDTKVLSGDLEILANRKIKLVIGVMKQELAMMSGAVKLLKKLKDKNYLMALASSSPKVVINFVVNKLEIGKYFEAIISADDVSQGKPDPAIYLLAAKELEVKPGDCIVLEDAPNGVKAANVAGMKTIGVINEFADREALSGADIIMSNLTEFDINWLE